MAVFDWEEINKYKDGGEPYNFGKEASVKVRDFVCGLYKDYRGFFISQPVVENPISDFLHGAWDSVCSYPNSPGLPSEPTPPFTGGQCETCYVVGVRANWDGGYGEYRLPGPIRGARYRPGSNGGCDVLCGWPPCGQPIAYEGPGQGAFTFSAGSPQGTITIYILRRVDGLADNCGNPGGPINTAPPPVDRCRDNLPIPRSPDRPGSPWQIPIVYIPVTPTFNLKVDVGGINFNIDVGGITIETGKENPANGCDTSALEDAIAFAIGRLNDISDSVISIENDTNLLPETLNRVREIEQEHTELRQGELTIYDCENKEGTLPFSGRGFQLIVSGLTAISDSTSAIQEHLCEKAFDLVPPERFLLSPGKDIPQLVFVYRNKYETGRFGTARSQITIPHPSSSAIAENWIVPQSLRTFEHGAFEGIGMLDSGAKIIVNCQSEEEAKRMLETIKSSVIDPAYSTNYQARVAERFGTRILDYTAHLRFVYYYSDGSKSEEPTWFKRFS